MWPKRKIQKEVSRLQKLGDIHLRKCDFFLAKKLYLQADITNPKQTDAYAAFERASALEKTLDSEARERFSDSSSQEEKFDFLVVHSGRCGTTATQNFLSLHPNLIINQKWEIDVALENSEEELLLCRYLEKKHRAEGNMKMGLVQHSYAAGVRGYPDIARRIAKIVNNDKFFHLVRDPGDLVVSFYNHILVSRFASGYIFPGSQHFSKESVLQSKDGSLLWPQQWQVSPDAPILGWRENAKTGGALSFGCEITDEITDEACREALSVTCFDTIGRNYGKHFRDCIPIDANELSPGNVKEGMRRMFSEIGIDPSFYHLAFEALASSRARRAMVNNFIELTGLPTPLFVNLDFAYQSLYSYTWPLLEAAVIEPDDQCKAAGLGSRPLSLSVNMDQWALLPLETRRWLIEDRILETFLVKVMLPAWLDVFDAWNKAMTPHLASGLEYLDAKGILARGVALETLKRELGEFLKCHPQFSKNWPIVSEIFAGR